MVVGVADSCVEDEEETEGTFGIGGILDDDTVQIHVQANIKCLMTILDIIIYCNNNKLPPVTMHYLNHL